MNWLVARSAIVLDSKSGDILRAVDTRSSLFVFKEDGCWRISGNNGSFSESEFDRNIILLAPDSAVALGNQVYALTSQGVLAISDTGSEIISKPIEKTLLSLQGLSLANLKNLTFAVARETEGEYELRLPTAANDTSCTQAFIYNTRTGTWTRDTLTSKHGVVNPTDDKRYLAGATQVLKERKDFAYTDYSDVDLSVTVLSSGVGLDPDDYDTRAMWRLDETSSIATAVDETGNYPLATVSGTPTLSSGKFGYSRDWNQNSYVKGDADTASVTKICTTRDWTLMFWIYADGASTGHGIMGLMESDESDWPLYVKLLNTTLGIYIGSKINGNSGSGTAISLATWTHIAFTYTSPSDMQPYINGVADGAPISINLALTAGALVSPKWILGRAYNGATVTGLDGRLDEVAFINTVLTAPQLLAIAQAGSGIASTQVTLLSATGVSVGDILVAGDTERISAVSGNVLTVDSGTWTAGAGTIKTGINSVVKWAPYTAGAPELLKQFQSATFLLGNAHAATVTVSYQSDLISTAGTASVNLATEAGQWVAAGTPWDGVERPFNLRLGVTQEHRRAAQLFVKWTHQNAWAHYALNGLSIAHANGSNRVGK